MAPGTSYWIKSNLENGERTPEEELENLEMERETVMDRLTDWMSQRT